MRVAILYFCVPQFGVVSRLPPSVIGLGPNLFYKVILLLSVRRPISPRLSLESKPNKRMDVDHLVVVVVEEEYCESGWNYASRTTRPGLRVPVFSECTHRLLNKF